LEVLGCDSIDTSDGGIGQGEYRTSMSCGAATIGGASISSALNIECVETGGGSGIAILIDEGKVSEGDVEIGSHLCYSVGIGQYGWLVHSYHLDRNGSQPGIIVSSSATLDVETLSRYSHIGGTVSIEIIWRKIWWVV